MKDDQRVTTLKRLSETEVPELRISKPLFEAVSKINFEDESISWRGLRRMAVEQYQKLGEANSSQAFAQLLRAGIQTIANAWYLRTEVGWPGYVAETSSDKRQEFHAPLYNSQLPRRTGAGERYSENRLAGVDREIINYKYMGGESFERELFDDDQTGQIRQRAQNLGSAMKVLEEVYIAGRIIGAATSIGGVDIPASTYSTVNANGTTISTPFSTALYATAEGNRPGTFTQLSFPAMKTARAALLNAKDPLGVKILVRPNALVVSTFDELNVRTFLNSAWYPAVQGQAGQTASSAASGASGQFGAINPFVGLSNPYVNIYLPNGAWFMGEAHKGMVFQRRDPLEVIQELPQSGLSFDTDQYRFRSRSRWEADYIDSRFWYMGNDGTAALLQ